MQSQKMQSYDFFHKDEPLASCMVRLKQVDGLHLVSKLTFAAGPKKIEHLFDGNIEYVPLYHLGQFTLHSKRMEMVDKTSIPTFCIRQDSIEHMVEKLKNKMNGSNVIPLLCASGAPNSSFVKYTTPENRQIYVDSMTGVQLKLVIAAGRGVPSLLFGLLPDFLQTDSFFQDFWLDTFLGHEAVDERDKLFVVEHCDPKYLVRRPIGHSRNNKFCHALAAAWKFPNVREAIMERYPEVSEPFVVEGYMLPLLGEIISKIKHITFDKIQIGSKGVTLDSRGYEIFDSYDAKVDHVIPFLCAVLSAQSLETLDISIPLLKTQHAYGFRAQQMEVLALEAASRNQQCGLKKLCIKFIDLSDMDSIETNPGLCLLSLVKHMPHLESLEIRYDKAAFAGKIQAGLTAILQQPQVNPHLAELVVPEAVLDRMESLFVNILSNQTRLRLRSLGITGLARHRHIGATLEKVLKCLQNEACTLASLDLCSIRPSFDRVNCEENLKTSFLEIAKCLVVDVFEIPHKKRKGNTSLKAISFSGGYGRNDDDDDVAKIMAKIAYYTCINRLNVDNNIVCGIIGLGNFISVVAEPAKHDDNAATNSIWFEPGNIPKIQYGLLRGNASIWAGAISNDQGNDSTISLNKLISFHKRLGSLIETSQDTSKSPLERSEALTKGLKLAKLDS